jgi:hypothetical protein
MLARDFMSNELCPAGIQAYVAIGMIEMPVRVDQVRDGSALRPARPSVI